MHYLSIKQAVTIVRLADSTGADTPLPDQFAPFLGGDGSVLLDMGGATVTSMQIGELVALARSFDGLSNGAAPKISLYNLSDQTREVFKVTKLDAMFPVFDTLQDALVAGGVSTN